jgi:FixJ family two-component response regulator
MNAPFYLIDDDKAVRDGLALLFEAHGLLIEVFDDPLLFLEKIDKGKPGTLLIDLKMPHVSGLELHKRLLEREIVWPAIMITGDGDIHSCRSAFQSGMVDFLTKPIDQQALFAALRKAQKNLDDFLERCEARALVAKLTARESEILHLICRGVATRQIAEVLAVSPRTIDGHRARINEKLGTASIAEFLQIVQTAEQSALPSDGGASKSQK